MEAPDILVLYELLNFRRGTLVWEIYFCRKSTRYPQQTNESGSIPRIFFGAYIADPLCGARDGSLLAEVRSGGAPLSIEYIVTFALISAAGVILASVLNVSNFSRSQKQEAKEESSSLAASLATMSTTLDHMDLSIRDMRSEMSVTMRDIKQDIKEHRDMIVKTQERVLAAHQRLDELTGRRGVGANGKLQ